jgi:hypothetical protein
MMSDKNDKTIEESAVQDVRRIRERFSREAGRDLHRHVEQTMRAFEELRKTLDLEVVSPPGAKAAGVR